MTDQLAVWHADHIHFSTLLDLLEEQVIAFHRGAQPNYGLMGEIIYYMRNFGDRVHHPREDVAYALLVERDPGMQIVVSRLLQEHRVIATVGEEFLSRLNEAERDMITSRAAWKRLWPCISCTTAIIFPPRKGTSCRAQRNC